MDPLLIRAHLLNEGDKIKKLGAVYVVVQVDETGIYYKSENIADKSVREKETQRFGTASQEIIELVERSNFSK